MLPVSENEYIYVSIKYVGVWVCIYVCMCVYVCEYECLCVFMCVYICE